MILCHWFHEGGGFRFGTLPLDQLRAHHVETIVTNDRVQGRPASTINKVMLLLRGFCRWLHAKGYVGAPILAADSEVMRREQEGKRTRRLSAEERQRLLACCDPRLRARVEAALETGCRSGEISRYDVGDGGPRQEDDQVACVAHEDLARAAPSRSPPASRRCCACVATIPSGEELPPTARVFGDELGNPVGSIKRAWRTATRKAGISNLRFHDLRREAASTLLERGIPLHFVSKILGHSNVATTSIYLSASSVDLRNAFDEMERREREAAEGRQQRPPAQANPDDTPSGVDRASHAANANLSARCTTAIN